MCSLLGQSRLQVAVFHSDSSVSGQLSTEERDEIARLDSLPASPHTARARATLSRCSHPKHQANVQ